MARSKRHRKYPRKKIQLKKKEKFILLDQLSVERVEKLKKFGEQYIKFHWDYYNDLVYQRSKISNEIKKSFLLASKERFNFSKWKRVLRYRYSHLPLSVAGSLKDIGGRFNIGDIDSPQIANFPALYIAVDFETGIQELLSQKIEKDRIGQQYDFALTNANSFTSVSLSGCLDHVIDLREPDRLKHFMGLIKDISISDNLKKEAKKINEKTGLIYTIPALINAILIPNWRLWPMQLNVPSASQIFGQFVSDASIEGIVYPSKFTGNNCLAIFPQNFTATDSYIELDDESPSEVKIRRIDADTWKKNQSELMGN